MYSWSFMKDTDPFPNSSQPSFRHTCNVIRFLTCFPIVSVVFRREFVDDVGGQQDPQEVCVPEARSQAQIHSQEQLPLSLTF